MANEDITDGELYIHINRSGFVDPPGKSKPKYKVALGKKVKFKLNGGVNNATVTFPNGSPFDGVSRIVLSSTSPSPALTADSTGPFEMQVQVDSELAGLSGTLDVDSKTED